MTGRQLSTSALALALALGGCGTKKDEPAATPPVTDKAPPAAGTAAPAAPAAPAPTGDPTDVVYHPTCNKLFPPEVIAKTHGADTLRVDHESDGQAGCYLEKGGTSKGMANVECRPGFDTSAAQAFKVEREAMTAAKELTPMIGRDGYRLGDTAYILLDDDTPCRLHVSWVAPPPDAADHLRAIMAQVTPASIK